MKTEYKFYIGKMKEKLKDKNILNEKNGGMKTRPAWTASGWKYKQNFDVTWWMENGTYQNQCMDQDRRQ